MKKNVIAPVSKPAPNAAQLPVADEGCIIDVRPKPRGATKEVNGEHYLDLLYSVIEGGLEFEIPALEDGEAEVSTYRLDKDEKYPLRKGANKLRLVHEGGKVTLRLIYPDGKLEKITNDQPHLAPYNPIDPVQHPTREALEDLEEDKVTKRVVRICTKGRGFESGFTLIGKGLLLQPSDVRVPPKP